jgi:L,D-peptidoglycan transpeptidase YkuD (ErfK/YbiS/YcfS/YnhG family)
MYVIDTGRLASRMQPLQSSRMRRPVPWLLAALPLCAACSLAPERAVARLDLPATTAQVLLCTTAGWNATAARILCLERTGSGWHCAGDPIPAQVGRRGLGWGLGLHADGPHGPKKHEGDGRAPAGMFALGPAFGYAEAPPPGVTMPWRPATARDYFVDAVDSPAYNQWQRVPDGEPNEPARHWSSCERMRRDDDQYQFGLVVGHNTAVRIPGRGSAIFLHVEAGPGQPTSGCTAMAKDDLLRVLAWLRPEAEPLLIQLPRSELARLRRSD